MSGANFGAGPGRLFILLPVHNRREITVRFVESLARQSWRELRLILIDDGSTDGTANALKSIWPAVEVITGDGNWWWAGCLDQGCQYLARIGVKDDDVLLIVNDDLSFRDDFLKQAMTEFGSMSDTLLLARQVDAATDEEIGHGGGIRLDVNSLRFAATPRTEEINCLPTRGLFLRWRDLRRAGGFRPQRLPHYLSDYEFTYRAWRRGLRLKVATLASVGMQLEHSGESWDTVFRLSRARRCRMFFSRRFKNNPVTWSMFAQLTASPVRRPYLWAKIWSHFLLMMARSLFIAPRRSSILLPRP